MWRSDGSSGTEFNNTLIRSVLDSLLNVLHWPNEGSQQVRSLNESDRCQLAETTG